MVLLKILGVTLALFDNVDVRSGLSAARHGCHESAVLGPDEVQVGLSRFSSVFSRFQFALESTDARQVRLRHALLEVSIKQPIVSLNQLRATDILVALD